MMGTFQSRAAMMALCVVTVWPMVGWSQQPPAQAKPVQDHAPGKAAGIDIRAARIALRDEVYYLDAEIDYRLSRTVEEALLKGIAVPIVLNIEVDRERAFLWSETTASLEQRYVLEHHALTQQYIVRNANIGTQSAYPSLEAAIASLGRVRDLPVIDSNLLTPGEEYSGRVRAAIDINSLPVPLRLLAIVSPEWRLSSEWYEWQF